MGRDTDRLQIISMNASGRKGRQYMNFRKSCLEDVIGSTEPDILFLPGDEPYMSPSILGDYRQEHVTHNNETVLLYDTKRLRLKKPDFHDSVPSLVVPGVDGAKLMYRQVEILAPPPTQHVVKYFQCLSWHWELTQGTSEELYKFGGWYLMLAQFFAWCTGVEVLIGGDFNLQRDQIQQLIKEHNNLIEKEIDCVKPFFRQLGYMDCMTENVNRPQRRLRQMKLHQCKALPSTQQDTDYFIASKEMQLCNTEMIEGSKLPARCTKMTMAKPTGDYCPLPTKTQMCIPNRPPRHNGG